MLMPQKLLKYLTTLAVCVLLLLITLLIFVNGIKIFCRSQADQTYTCGVQVMFLDRFPTVHRNIPHIVDVAISDDGCTDGCAYRTEFITSDGKLVAVHEVHTDYGSVATQTDEMKRLLHSGKPSFEYHIQPTWWILFLLVGLFLIYVVPLTLADGADAVREFFAQQGQLPS
jgi:hypothetical protein